MTIYNEVIKFSFTIKKIIKLLQKKKFIYNYYLKNARYFNF